MKNIRKFRFFEIPYILFCSSLKSVRCCAYIDGYHCLERMAAKPFWRQNDALARQDRHQAPSYWYWDDAWWFWARENHRHVAQLGLSSELDHFEWTGSTNHDTILMDFETQKFSIWFSKIRKNKIYGDSFTFSTVDCSTCPAHHTSRGHQLSDTWLKGKALSNDPTRGRSSTLSYIFENWNFENCNFWNFDFRNLKKSIPDFSDWENHQK